MSDQRGVRKWQGLGWFGTTSEPIRREWQISSGSVKYSYQPPRNSTTVKVPNTPTTMPISSATSVLRMARV